MPERLDHQCTLALGTRDAVHVPIIVARAAQEVNYHSQLIPGGFVKFTDDAFTKYIPCEKNEAHGILNPFIGTISRYDNVIVFLIPGITTPVHHHFDINLRQPESEAWVLEAELAERQAEDPGCASCYEIVNWQVIRN